MVKLVLRVLRMAVGQDGFGIGRSTCRSLQIIRGVGRIGAQGDTRSGWRRIDIQRQAFRSPATAVRDRHR